MPGPGTPSRSMVTTAAGDHASWDWSEQGDRTAAFTACLLLARFDGRLFGRHRHRVLAVISDAGRRRRPSARRSGWHGASSSTAGHRGGRPDFDCTTEMLAEGRERRARCGVHPSASADRGGASLRRSARRSSPGRSSSSPATDRSQPHRDDCLRDDAPRSRGRRGSYLEVLSDTVGSRAPTIAKRRVIRSHRVHLEADRSWTAPPTVRTSPSGARYRRGSPRRR